MHTPGSRHRLGKIDTDAEQALAGGFGICSIPTLMDGVLLFEVDKVRALDMSEVNWSS